MKSNFFIQRILNTMRFDTIYFYKFSEKNKVKYMDTLIQFHENFQYCSCICFLLKHETIRGYLDANRTDIKSGG